MERTNSVDQKKVLQMQDVCLNYGLMPALIGLSMSVNEDEIVTLLGANGAGKTTTLNAICGILPIIRGEILFRGKRINGLTPQKLVDLGIVHIPEGRRIFAPMSVMDNLILGAYCRYGRKEKEAIERDFEAVFKLFPVLGKQRKRLSGTLSGENSKCWRWREESWAVQSFCFWMSPH